MAPDGTLFPLTRFGYRQTVKTLFKVLPASTRKPSL
jgi:hypothetical protein